MIWHRGEIIADDALRVPASDRTFEHGLGLFETLRTWDGRAVLLDRHLARMSRSAEALGLPLDARMLPDHEAVSRLLGDGDSLLRITLTGGSADSPCLCWMKASPLPPGADPSGLVIEGYWNVDAQDPLARHKTLNYWHRRLASEDARRNGSDESLSRSRDGRLWEGARTNLFVAYGDRLSTPRIDGPLVPGIMRGVVLERAARLGVDVREGELTPSALKMASEAFLTNSVRGVLPVRRFRDKTFPAPGPVAARLMGDIRGWLERGGIDR